MANHDEQPHASLTKNSRRVRPAVAILSVIFISIGICGFIVSHRNATFVSQDSDVMPTTMATESESKQPWMDFGCSMIPIGIVGLVMLPFSFRNRHADADS